MEQQQASRAWSSQSGADQPQIPMACGTAASQSSQNSQSIVEQPVEHPVPTPSSSTQFQHPVKCGAVADPNGAWNSSSPIERGSASQARISQSRAKQPQTQTACGIAASQSSAEQPVECRAASRAFHSNTQFQHPVKCGAAADPNGVYHVEQQQSSRARISQSSVEQPIEQGAAPDPNGVWNSRKPVKRGTASRAWSSQSSIQFQHPVPASSFSIQSSACGAVADPNAVWNSSSPIERGTASRAWSSQPSAEQP